METAEVIGSTLAAIGNVSNMDIPAAELTANAKWNYAFAKIQLVAPIDVVEDASNYSTALTGAFLKLLARRGELEKLKGEKTGLESVLPRANSAAEHALSLMKNFNLDGESDQNRFNRYKGEFDFQKKTMNEYNSKIEELDQKLLSGIAALSIECAQEIQKLVALVIPLMISMRCALGMPLDEESYSRIIEQSSNQTMENLDEFIATFRNLFDLPQ